MLNRIISCSLLFLFSTAALADNSLWSSFSVDTSCSSTDVSIIYLIQLFGTVGNVLASTNSCGGAQLTVFGFMFSAFNIVALGLGVLMITYTIGLGILNTAESGKFLGEKLSSIWIPVRTALGTALLVPADSNGYYCVAQMLMMWFIVNGVGAANTIWSYAAQFGVGKVTAPIYGITSGDMQTAYAFLKGVINLEICRQVQANRISGNGAPVVPISSPGALGPSGQTYSIIYSNNSPENTCGSVPFNQVSSDDFPQTSKNSGLSEAKNKANRGNWDLQQYTISNLPFGQPYASIPNTNGANLASMGEAGAVLATLINAAVNPDTSQVTFPVGNAATNQSEWQPYIDAARTWAYYYAYNIKMTGLANSLTDPSSAAPSTASELTKGGWLSAGWYYYQLVQVTSTPTNAGNPNQAQIKNLSTVVPPLATFVEGLNMTSSVPYNTAKQLVQNGLMKPITESSLSKAALYDDLIVKKTGSAAAAQSFSDGMEALGQAYSSSPSGSLSFGAAIMSLFTSTIANQKDTNGDPIIALVQQGESMMIFSAAIMIYVLIAGPIAAALTAVCDVVYNFFDPLMGLYITLIPVMYMILGAIYLEGAMLAVYLPLIPLLSFIVGGIGWLIAVIEAMAAAPIIAIGLTIPEGQHDILGRAEPAFLMTLNLILRPTLMIIGFVMAIVLLRIAFDFFNTGFGEFLSSGMIRTDKAFGYIVIIAAYIAMVIGLTQRVFGLINHLPDRVLSWIGEHGAGTPGAEQMLGEAKGAISSRGEMIGRGGGEAARGLSSPQNYKMRKSKPGADKGAGGTESLGK